MTINYELFQDDPRNSYIPNNGVAKVAGMGDVASATVKYELQHFVCEGAYEDGLVRILSSYASGVGGEQAPAWISGFYGSGKSHLVKVLGHLWLDQRFSDGSTPRGLVPSLPEGVRDGLRELDVIGARNGGRLAAAGDLLKLSKNINQAFLEIVLGAVGLPTDIAAARCVLWLRAEGLLRDVMEWLAHEGDDWEVELENLYVGKIAEAVRALRPDWAPSADMARHQLEIQFPPESEVLVPQVMKLTAQALESVSDKDGRIPATLVVLDELQQYINDDPARAAEVQGLVEACSNRFDGLLLIVATGQSDLGSTPTLQKLIDRFAVRQQLSDTDVEKVIREVVLRKRADRVNELDSVLEQNSGEIDRELAGARISPTGADKPDLVADYPLLPSRRRFWEAALKGIDPGGRTGQLRTQLNVVHDANKRVADDPVGTVVPADFLYFQQAPGMLQSGALLREVHQLIEGERANGDDGPLRARVLALVFLISKLSREGFADTGVRSTAAHIADLLVDDLGTSGAALRRDVPRILEELRDESKLSRMGEEYQLQSKTGQEWTQDFQQRKKIFLADSARLAGERDALLRAVAQRQVPPRLVQGVSKEARAVSVVFGDTQPLPGDGVTVWVRTGWDTTEKQFLDTATAAGTDSPLLFVFLAKPSEGGLDSVLAESIAAKETLDSRPTPNTGEGREAQKVMQSIADTARISVAARADEIVRRALVRQAGGAAVEGASLTAKLESAGQKALDRLYPKFSQADAVGWQNAFARAQAGNTDWLGAVGWRGDAKDHPVCKEVLASVTAVGTSGADVRQKLTAPKFGWPTDAIYAALAGLVLAGDVTAAAGGTALNASGLKPTAIGKVLFRKESQTLDIDTRMRARGVLTALGIVFAPNEEVAPCTQVATQLQQLAQSTGGSAPLPPVQTTALLGDLKSKSGNDLVFAVANADTEIKKLVASWKSIAGKVTPRREQLSRAERLLAQLDGSGDDLRAQLGAIKSNRSMLEEPNPLTPIEQAAADSLREQLHNRVQAYSEALDAARAELASDVNWLTLSDEQRERALQQYRLNPVDAPKTGSTSELLAALDSRSVTGWDDLKDALPGRLQSARTAAAKLVEPTATQIKLPSKKLSSLQDIDAYVEDVRNQLVASIGQYKTILV